MNQYAHAPHVEGPPKAPADAPNAALLIDFDNVTMGMRSDLSKELKSLLQSDIIRGKVTVQRAYADWRRYPQYIVPLSEASVDLIFAPAYGSSKKNATDIRMAIDGVELVFIRPEIGTFILLTGDSDFSSLVLKLKEYGKYVIGVGIQESSSDILVQNCDEYYNYTSLTGLRKTTETSGKGNDPWGLVEQAVSRMKTRGDVMRSDRLKQVMLEIDARFSEGNFGFSKFSKFVAEAANRGILRLHKRENGQYEVKPGSSGKSTDAAPAPRESKGRSRPSARRGRPARPQRQERAESVDSKDAEVEAEPLRAAYDLMRGCLQKLKEAGKSSTRDSDVKRRMLEVEAGFDEGELGFGKFSRFLMQAEEHGVISLEKTATGNYRVSLAESGDGRPQPAPVNRAEAVDLSEAADRPEEPTERAAESASTGTSSGPSSIGRLGPRGGSGDRRDDRDGPVFFEGQIVGRSPGAPSPSSTGVRSGGVRIDAVELGLPTSEGAIVSYLTNSYGGVGKKTAEALVEAFGREIFAVFENEPGRVSEIVPRRASNVLAEWKADLARRSDPSTSEPEAVSEPDDGAGSGGSAGSGEGTAAESASTDQDLGGAPEQETNSEPAPQDSSPSSAPAQRSGGARRRTRRSSRRPSSDSDG